MTAAATAPRSAGGAVRPRDLSRRIAVVRAVLALGWAAAFLAAVGTGPHHALPLAAAALLTSYPAIDAVASFTEARLAAPGSGRLLRVNGAISLAAVAALAATSFAGPAAGALAAFGVWATVSGALQLGTALRRRATGRQLPMIISGGLSTLAGLSFAVSAAKGNPSLAGVAGYMALGAVLFLVWAGLRRTSAPANR